MRISKLVNFKTNYTDKVLREINFNLMFDSDPLFAGISNCYYDLWNGRGERITMISQFFPFNLEELILTDKLKD